MAWVGASDLCDVVDDIYVIVYCWVATIAWTATVSPKDWTLLRDAHEWLS